MDRDEVLVKLVEQECIIWKRNHPQFKSVAAKEQAWARVAFQLGITTTEAERRFKSIREKYRRRKILLERDAALNPEHSKIKRWDLYNKLGFLDDFMIPRNGNESLGMIGSVKGDSGSNENISSTNEVSILPISNQKFHTSTPNSQHNYEQQLMAVATQKNQQIGNVIIQPVIRHNNKNMLTIQRVHHDSRSSQSTPSPSTTTANIATETSTENIHLDPIVKMEVPDDDESQDKNTCTEPKICENGNFNYVGEFIAAELNKLPLRDAFVLKNILIREVLTFSEKLLLARDK